MNPTIASLLLFYLSSVHSASLGDQECNATMVNGKYYVKETVKNLNGIPADMAVNFRSGNIYFTLINKDMRMSLHRFKEGREIEKISVNNLGQSSLVDNVNNVVYLATDNGVYKFNEENGTARIFTALGEDVMYLATADNGKTLFIATWPQNRVQKIVGRKSESFPTVVNGHGLTIDNGNNIYYEAVRTPYVLRNGDRVSIKINGFKNDSTVDFFVAKSGDVFAMDEFSNLYRIDPMNAYATVLGTFNMQAVNTFGLDKDDNILIGIQNYIIKWAPSETNPCL